MKNKDITVKQLIKKLEKIKRNKKIAFGDANGKFNGTFLCIDDEVLEETDCYFLIFEKD
jgi:hypothetical protein